MEKYYWHHEINTRNYCGIYSNFSSYLYKMYAVVVARFCDNEKKT